MPDDTAILPSSDGHHDRADMAAVWRAIKSGWRIPDEWKSTLPQVAAKIAADPSKPDRDRLRALELLAKLDTENFGRLLEAVKVDRGYGAPQINNTMIVAIAPPTRARIEDD